ncbi:MAG: FHA domain-containing protein [Anaerolineae bacterium]|nr:FHA domain-containing protein [Anaerolineae bacterium]
MLGRRKDIAAPDLVDLGPHDAYKLGVSRNHAVLTYKDNRLYIQDTGSVNGTWQSGQRLKPYELYAIQPGASISLGRLLVYIYY